MRFVLLAEGDTEKRAVADFLKRWLDPKLKAPVGIKVVNLRGNRQAVSRIVAKARDYLDGPDADEIVAVIGLLDLYGLDIYPRQLTPAKDRYEWAVKEFERQVDRTKFRMCFAVHEFEAWILAQPDVLPREVCDGLPKTIANPENVNFDEPPAKLLNRIYTSRLRKSYKKTVYGPHLFSKLSPDIVAGKCPHFKQMLEEMCCMATKAGLAR